MADVKVSIQTVPWMLLTFFVFMALKLSSVIQWSWWWVTAPLWMPPAFALGWLVFVLVFAFVVGAAALLIEGWQNRW